MEASLTLMRALTKTKQEEFVAAAIDMGLAAGRSVRNGICAGAQISPQDSRDYQAQIADVIVGSHKHIASTVRRCNAIFFAEQFAAPGSDTQIEALALRHAGAHRHPVATAKTVMPGRSDNTFLLARLAARFGLGE